MYAIRSYYAHLRRRREDQGHQGSPRAHQPRTERGQGSRGVGSDCREGRRQQGGGRGDQEEVRGGGSSSRAQVVGLSSTVRCATERIERSARNNVV